MIRIDDLYSLSDLSQQQLQDTIGGAAVALPSFLNQANKAKRSETTEGLDLNRNFPQIWGYDNEWYN